jgi:hypothetical protein
MAKGRVKVKIDRAAADRIGLDVLKREVGDVTRRIFNRATILCPVDFGVLRASHHMKRPAVAPPGVRAEVYNDADYALAVHDGSGPYVIRPKPRKTRTGRPPMLKFEVDGRTVYAREVRHPGTRGRPWLARAAREVAAQSGFTWTPG